MAFQLQSSLARRLISDPVMALKVIMNANLDVFQAARFRHWWFCPTVMDHSGVSTGKSEMAFLLVMLRLILLPLVAPRKPRIVTVYYQSQGTAEEVFLPKIDEYLSRSKVFENQIKKQHGNRFYQTKKNVIIIEMREGGWCELPAGDFMKDSQNQASKRFNDLIIDEGAMIDQLGKGINKQLLQRNTRECFNPNHPVHANHTLFLGHAESPQHVYFKRFSGIRRAARKRGSQDHMVITSSYRDYRGESLRKYGQDVAKKAREQYLTELDESEHGQIYDGLWKPGTKGYYSETLSDSIIHPGAGVHLRRENRETVYQLGWDTASALTEGSDWTAGVVTAAHPVQVVIPDMPGFMRIGLTLWFARAVYAIFLPRGADVDQKAGAIHHLHNAFGFSGITMDSRGGGIEVYMKLRNSRQLINNRWVEDCTGLCTPKEAHEWSRAQPIISFYDRNEPLFAPIFGEKFVADNTGPIDCMNREMKSLMRLKEIAWPARFTKLDAVTAAGMSDDQLRVMKELEMALDQFQNINVKTDKNGNPEMSEKGFQKFTHVGKKDGAMASCYSFLGLRATIQRSLAGRKPTSENAVMGVY